jgi:hypothetical protein
VTLDFDLDDDTIRYRAIHELMAIAADEDADNAMRGQAAEVVLIDIREHRSLDDETSEQRDAMNAQLERMESAYTDLRKAMDELPTKP